MGEPLSRRTFVARGSIALGALVLGCTDIAKPTAAPTAATSFTPAPSKSSGPTAPPSNQPTPQPTASADLQRMVAGLLVVGFRGTTVKPTDPIVQAVKAGLGGVILFSWNVVSPQQLTQLTAALHAAAAPRRLIVAVDQEGGVVRRLTPAKGWAAIPSEATVGAKGAAYATKIGRMIGAQLRAAGINLNLAPVVDLNVNPNNPSIGALGRSYSADPQVVTDLATAEIGGQHEHGVRTTLKHFPGLGSATGNTDREFVDVTATWKPVELMPYRNLVAAGIADVVMTANALNGQIDTRYPASLSAASLSKLRSDVGFNGVAITDDLGAGAIIDSYSTDAALRLALNAGNDLLLLANTGTYRPTIAADSISSILASMQAGKISKARATEASGRVAALLAKLNGPAG